MNRLVWILILFLLTTAVEAEEFIYSQINVSHGLSDNQIRFILQLPDGRMIFKTSGNLNLYDGSHFKYIHGRDNNIYPLTKFDGYYRIYQSEDSLLWIKDTYKLMCVNLRQEKYIPDLETFFESRGIKQNVEDIFVDSEQQWWFLIPEGLLQHETSEVLDLPTNQGRLQDLMTDNDKLYLFYSTGNMACYDLKTKNKLYSKKAYPVDEEEKFIRTSLVVKGQDGFYQLRTGSKGGFFFFDTRRLIWKKLLETEYNLNTIIVSQNETAFISCKSGIWIVNRRTGQKQYLPLLKTVNGNIIHTEMSTVFSDKQGGFWLGTHNQGLLYYHPSRYKFSHIGPSYFPESFKEDVIVQSFAEDSAGNIYIKCQSKIYKLQLSVDNSKSLIPVSLSLLPKEVQIKLKQQKQNVFQGKYYRAVHTDERGWNWLGTRDGLILHKPEIEEQRFFYTEDGLSNNSIHAILEDRNLNLWLTTSYGISKIRIDSITQKIQIISFNPLDGTLDGEYTMGAVYEAKDGTLFFGGVNGFNILKINNIPSTPLPFKPVITNLFLRGEKIEIGKSYDGQIILPVAAPYLKELDFAYNQNFLTFEFSALNYLNPNQTRYRYKLKGINSEWIETYAASESFGTNGNIRISYTNLPPGEYILSVMASGNNNVWEGKASELKISINPPWWKTNTAYTLYSIFIILIVSVSIYLYTLLTRKKLDRQHKEEILLLRIRNLIEQQKQLEAEKDTDLSNANIEQIQTENMKQLSSANSEFISKAIRLVEKNLNEPKYSVEQLSSDLCMDRTGLYRKLITELDKSPSLFIRSIRLQRAAQLILEEKLSISEIAEKTGFSSSSYLSKCFLEMYSCRPTEYADYMKKST